MKVDGKVRHTIMLTENENVRLQELRKAKGMTAQAYIRWCLLHNDADEIWQIQDMIEPVTEQTERMRDIADRLLSGKKVVAEELMRVLEEALNVWQSADRYFATYRIRTGIPKIVEKKTKMKEFYLIGPEEERLQRLLKKNDMTVQQYVTRCMFYKTPVNIKDIRTIAMCLSKQSLYICGLSYKLHTIKNSNVNYILRNMRIIKTLFRRISCNIDEKL